MVKAIGENLLRFDLHLFTLFSSRHDGRLLPGFYTIMSRLGDGHVYIVLAVWQLFFCGVRGRLFFMMSVVAFAMELPVYILIKRSVKRLRPFELFPEIRFLIPPPDRYSFPSGHTAAAFMVARLIGWLYPGWAVVLFIPAALIGYSRIYLRVHYPSDVFFGALLGLIAAGLSIMIVT